MAALYILHSNQKKHRKCCFVIGELVMDEQLLRPPRYPKKQSSVYREPAMTVAEGMKRRIIETRAIFTKKK